MSKDEPTKHQDAPASPARRWIVWVYVAASVTLILATVLLSNDYKNLRLVGWKLGLNVQQQTIRNVSVTVKRVSLSRSVFEYEPYLLSPPDLDMSAAFVRTWRASGPEMCESMRLEGIAMSEWLPSALGGEAFECSSDAKYDERAGTTRSAFVMIRGNAAGDVSSARIKLVNPQLLHGQLDERSMALFRAVLNQPLRLDMGETLDRIRALDAIDEHKLGTSIKFEREYSNSSNLNFILALHGLNPAQDRTEAYFSRRKWLFSSRTQEKPLTHGDIQ